MCESRSASSWCVEPLLIASLPFHSAQILLPIGQMARNSLYYSGKAPVRLTGEQPLPHITVCMPVCELLSVFRAELG